LCASAGVAALCAAYVLRAVRNFAAGKWRTAVMDRVQCRFLAGVAGKGAQAPRIVAKKSKVFPYSLPSVGPGADPGVQAVSPQVT